MANIFVTGIGTDVGKTVVSAILVEALQADYFKPVQAGDLDYSDTHKVQELISNEVSQFHPNSYALQTPMSPHGAAEIDNISIDIDNIQLPETKNHLVIEGAGGLLVPLNDHQTIADLILPDYKVIVVSRHYLGSINHSLLSLNFLKNRQLDTAVIFNGPETSSTENIIQKMTDFPIIGRLDEEQSLDKQTIRRYAEMFSDKLMAFINS